MKRIFNLAIILCLCTMAKANNVQISGVTTTVTGGTTVLNFNVQWDNSWRGGPANNYDAVWVFVKYRDERGWWSHLELTGSDITAPSGLAVTIPTDRKGCFIYRSADGSGNIASSSVSVGVVQKPGAYDVKVFGLEMVYIPQGSFYLGHSGGNSNNFGEAGTDGVTPFNVTSATPPVIGSNTGNLFDNRVAGTGTFNVNWPTGFNAFYIMKYELSQAGYRDFLNAIPGFTYYTLPERTDLTSVNYSTTGTKLFPNTAGSRNYLYVGSPTMNPIITDANANSTGNEASDGEWVAANFLYWSDAAAFLDWAALRPMTEFEYEKAVNGPNAPDYPQFATGTYFQVNPFGAISLPQTAGETVPRSSANSNYINTSEFWTTGTTPGPLRSGFAADATSTRLSSGGSFYGVMELSGNVWEPVVTAANVAGRSFNGNNLGDGSISALNARANEPTWPGTQSSPESTNSANSAGQVLKTNTAGISKKGGSFAVSLYSAVTDQNYNPASSADAYPTTRAAAISFGCRGVRQ